MLYFVNRHDPYNKNKIINTAYEEFWKANRRGAHGFLVTDGTQMRLLNVDEMILFVNAGQIVFDGTFGSCCDIYSIGEYEADGFEVLYKGRWCKIPYVVDRIFGSSYSSSWLWVRHKPIDGGRLKYPMLVDNHTFYIGERGNFKEICSGESLYMENLKKWYANRVDRRKELLEIENKLKAMVNMSKIGGADIPLGMVNKADPSYYMKYGNDLLVYIPDGTRNFDYADSNIGGIRDNLGCSRVICVGGNDLECLGDFAKRDRVNRRIMSSVDIDFTGLHPKGTVEALSTFEEFNFEQVLDLTTIDADLITNGYSFDCTRCPGVITRNKRVFTCCLLSKVNCYYVGK